ncbi:MAG: hypothetical protein IKH26_00310 [Bacteroidaceae bacterium]|nr:hypothetical protein [Bacteroidaceae bacterium]
MYWKNDEFRHEYLGQLSTYVSYYKENDMRESDNPPSVSRSSLFQFDSESGPLPNLRVLDIYFSLVVLLDDTLGK